MFTKDQMLSVLVSSLKAIILKRKIIHCLQEQGFRIGDKLEAVNNKETYKQLQSKARIDQIKKNIHFLMSNVDLAFEYSVDGYRIDPNKIDLEFIEVKPGTLEEKLFRWWNLIWWSVPYQRPYGRQMRFLIWDKGHNAPFGLILLQSPVLKMAVRDKSLGIPKEELDFWVNKSMNAQRVGALPPYNELLGGKMVALSLVCNELRKAYENKYKNYVSLIKGRKIDPELLFITTTSAFGRSSIYNRLKYKGKLIAESLGYTKGYGSFHIPDEIYKEMIDHLDRIGVDTSRRYGDGPSKKLKLMDQGLKSLGLNNFHRHGIKREFFLFSHVDNLYDVIHNNVEPIWRDMPFKDIEDFWKNRWLIPRSIRNSKFKIFDRNHYFYNVRKMLEELDE